MYLRAGAEYLDKPANFAEMKTNEYIDKHYHQPSDEIHPDWDLAGGVEDVQLMFLVALEIANRKEMPAWNAGDEFEAVRLQALQTRLNTIHP